MDRCVAGPIIFVALQSIDVLLIWPCDSCCSLLPAGASDGSVIGQFFLGHSLFFQFSGESDLGDAL
jgi:hypothetical protein